MDNYFDPWLHEHVDIPSWEEYFLEIAGVVAKRSKDAQTKCGCVITDHHHHIVGTGYNSFVKGANDNILPNLRPHNSIDNNNPRKSKYPWFIHSEINALNNITVNKWQYEYLIAYVTTRPCFNCIQNLWAGNVKEVCYPKNAKLAKMTEQEYDDFKFFINMVGMNVYKI